MREVKAELLFSRHQNAYLHGHGIGNKLQPFSLQAYDKCMEIGKWGVTVLSATGVLYILSRDRVKRMRNCKLLTTFFDMSPELLPHYFKANPHANKPE